MSKSGINTIKIDRERKANNLVIVDETMRNYDGHSYLYNLQVAKAVRNSSFNEVTIFANPDMSFEPSDIKIESLYVPRIFQKIDFLFKRKQNNRYLDVVRRSVRGFSALFSCLFYTINSMRKVYDAKINNFILFQYFRLTMIPALYVGIVLNEIFFRRSFTFLVVLRYKPEIFFKNSKALSFVFNWLLDFNQIKFFVDSRELCDIYSDFFRKDAFTVLPVPVLRSINGTRTQRNEISLSFMGATRGEKGFNHLPKIFDILRSQYKRIDWPIVLNIQINHPWPESLDETVEELKRLAMPNNGPNVTLNLIWGPLDEQNYRNLLFKTDINILLYEPEKYSASTSGVFSECLVNGIPSILYPGTVCERIIKDAEALNKTVGFIVSDLDQISDVISRFSRERKKIRADCLDFSEHYCNDMSGEGVVHMIEKTCQI